MRISVSKGLCDIHDVIIKQGTTFDVSIVLMEDKESWMERAFRSLRPHYVRTREEAVAVLKLYKELIDDPMRDHTS
jgi:hypothetical protein